MARSISEPYIIDNRYNLLVCRRRGRGRHWLKCCASNISRRRSLDRSRCPTSRSPSRPARSTPRRPERIRKSTLIKVLSGYHQPDPGAQAWANNDEPHPRRRPRRRRPIRFVHQDLGLIGSLSAVENIALTAGYHVGRFGQIRWRDEVRRTRESSMCSASPTSTSRRRSATCHRHNGPRWRSLARSSTGSRAPTCSCSTNRPRRCRATMSTACSRSSTAWKERGVSIVYVSHHLDEVFVPRRIASPFCATASWRQPCR